MDPALSEHDRLILESLDSTRRDQLALLLAALGDIPVSDVERRSLEWLAGWERHTVENLTAVITRARRAGRTRHASR
ncbi:MAG TPA: hypothetical protein VFQ77_07870 [Pseudonocardiaceae bacterium]|nr:hypothetical protein [Pseudonocardiaceae bacterium]